MLTLNLPRWMLQRQEHQEEGMTYPKLLKVSFTHSYSIYWDFPFYEPSLPLNTCRMWTIKLITKKGQKRKGGGYPDNHYLLRSRLSSQPRHTLCRSP